MVELGWQEVKGCTVKGLGGQVKELWFYPPPPPPFLLSYPESRCPGLGKEGGRGGRQICFAGL